MKLYSATTAQITVTVQPIYLDGQSDFAARRFVFAYFVRIENEGQGEVQLLRRHWLISDSGGNVKEIEGEGVVGKQPVIGPGESHEYNSYCILETFEGSMEGTYQMRQQDGDLFEVAIPRFPLRAASN